MRALLGALTANRHAIQRALAAAERDLVALRARSASLEETVRLARLMLLSMEVGSEMVQPALADDLRASSDGREAQ